MYIWSLKNLKTQLLGPGLSSRQDLAYLLVVLTCVSACTAETESEPVYLDKAAMMDPATCGECHQTHLTQWSGSMHAYASKDPVFLAMNARGQRETNGELGSFCVQCHAPMALRTGATTDGDSHLEVFGCALAAPGGDALSLFELRWWRWSGVTAAATIG